MFVPLKTAFVKGATNMSTLSGVLLGAYQDFLKKEGVEVKLREALRKLWAKETDETKVMIEAKVAARAARDLHSDSPLFQALARASGVPAFGYGLRKYSLA